MSYNIYDLARESGLTQSLLVDDYPRLKYFAAVVAASEREDILKMSADNWYKTQKDYDEAIRARGETK